MSSKEKTIIESKITTVDAKKDPPKKRGRKPKVKPENGEGTVVVVREPKKRGRKPKLVKAVEREMLQPRRRGRKPKINLMMNQPIFNEYQKYIRPR